MFVRNRVWEVVKEADVFFRCASKYASVQRQIRFGYKVAIPILAALIALFTKLNMPNYVFWSAVLIFVSSIIKSFCTQVVLPDKDIDRLELIGTEFEKHRIRDEELMEKLDNGEISDKEAIEELKKHSSNYGKKKSELNKLVLWIPFWVKKRLQKESDEYLLRVHYNQYDNNE